MLLGIVLHGSLPYFSRIAGIESIWPADDDQSVVLYLVFDWIHSWRMPAFFLLVGVLCPPVVEPPLNIGIRSRSTKEDHFAAGAVRGCDGVLNPADMDLLMVRLNVTGSTRRCPAGKARPWP